MKDRSPAPDPAPPRHRVYAQITLVGYIDLEGTPRSAPRKARAILTTSRVPWSELTLAFTPQVVVVPRGHPLKEESPENAS